MLVAGLWFFPLTALSGWIFLITALAFYLLALLVWVSGSSLLLALLVLSLLTVLSFVLSSAYLPASAAGIALGGFSSVIHKLIYKDSE